MTLSKAVRIRGDELEEIGRGKVVKLKVCCFAGLNLSSQCWRTGKERLGSRLLEYLGSRAINSVREQLQDKSFPYILVGKPGRRHPLEQVVLSTLDYVTKYSLRLPAMYRALLKPLGNYSYHEVVLVMAKSQYNIPTVRCPESNSNFRAAGTASTIASLCGTTQFAF